MNLQHPKEQVETLQQFAKPGPSVWMARAF